MPGEGKTSVILPMLAATLADGDALVRLTVLPPLFASALSLLRDRLGGLLGRAVATMPVSRDLDIASPQARDPDSDGC